MKELIRLDLNTMKNLPAIPTYELENCYTIINNKDFKQAIAGELLKRNDLKQYQVIKQGGSTKTVPIVKPKKDFLEAFIKMVVNKEINLEDYLNWDKIIKEYDKTFNKDLFIVELKEQEVRSNKFLKKK